MKLIAILVLGISTVACSSKPAQPAQAAKTKTAAKLAAYSTDAVTQELSDGGVQVQAPREQVQAFFRTHPAYHICKDTDARLVAVLRKTPGEPGPDDQYVALGYRTGKISSLDIGPPQFSADNVASCQ